MLYGAAYYHEYQPYERLEKDVAMMRDAGLNLARVAESTWSTWEPEDGRFELAWMERILDALHGAGVKVIFGTPTYAIPPWLHRKHPEIMAQLGRGQRLYYGGRQNVDISHPAFVFYAERIVRTLVAHFAQHPAVVGYQVDNETGLLLAHNPGLFQSYVDYLKARFGSVERLNEVWGLTYWSHRLADWADLWTPDGNTTPGYDLEWRRFQSKVTTDFLAWQTRIVKEYARPDQFVTHNLVGGHGRPAADRYEISQVVDVAADNPYHPTQDDLTLPQAGEGAGTVHGRSSAGAWSLYFNGDMARSGKQRSFLIAEMNANSIMGSSQNYPAYDGQWRLAAYTYISRGANSLEYWHWHTLHYGAETYWGGILGHDLEPNRCYREVSRIGHELQEHGDLLTDLTVEADAALLYSYDSKYAFEFHPCLARPDTGEPDPASYVRIFNTFYRAFFDARAQTAVVFPQQRLEAFRVLVCPATYVADDALLTRLSNYAAGGGHLVLTFRTGYADEYARARWVKAPGILRPAVGASYGEYSSLARPVGLRPGSGGLALPADARAEAWADGLELEGATALAYYDHPHFGRFPAVVSQPFGHGRVTYVGTLPSPSFGKALASWVLDQAGLKPAIADLPDSVRATTARTKDGRRLWFLTNWSFAEASVAGLPVAGTELFSRATVRPGGLLSLGPWDVKVVLES